MCELPYLNYSHTGHHGDNSVETTACSDRRTVSDCPSILMLIVNVKERTRSWGVGEKDTEDKMWTSDRGRHTTELSNEMYDLYVSHSYVHIPQVRSQRVYRRHMHHEW